MILNGYETIVGSKFKRTDNVESTLKTLSTTNRLSELNKLGVFGVDYDNGGTIPSFVFPMTTKNFKGQLVTIFDQRHYMNNKNRIVNGPEYNMIYVASVIQQQVAKGNRSILNSSEHITVKAFAKSVGDFLAGPSGMNLDQKLDLQIILAHYFICLLSNPDEDYAFVSANLIKRTLNISQQRSLPVIEEIGYVGTIKDLMNVLTTYDPLPTLRKLDTGALIATINRTWYVSSGFKMIMGAAAELPHLFTAICYATATNNLYRNTKIGQILDRRETPEIEDFVKVINSNVY